MAEVTWHRRPTWIPGLGVAARNLGEWVRRAVARRPKTWQEVGTAEMSSKLLRIRNRIGREYLTRRLNPRSHVSLVRLGSDYGGWWLPRDAVTSGAVAYCAGAGEDISFDLALHEAGVRVTTFDPTPRAIAYVTEMNPGPPFRFLPIG